jgi:hypothetical protein
MGLDNDVSNVLSEYINIRRNHDNVIQDIEHLININIFSEYLKSFDAFKHTSVPPAALVSLGGGEDERGGNARQEHCRAVEAHRARRRGRLMEVAIRRSIERDHRYILHGKERLRYANYLLTSDRKSNLLHNWPTKYPDFYTNEPVIRVCMSPQIIPDTLIRVSNEDYIIKETNWRLKEFPPDKDKYSIDQLLMLK